MVYVVERYLPGLSRSDLLHGLSRLELDAAEGPAVRYLGSTIVLGDEACFCQFEGPSEEAVAEANRTAGLSFDRIVPATTVRPTEGVPMTVPASVPVTIQIRRSRLLGLLAAVAVVVASITWAVVTFTESSNAETATSQTASPAEQAAFEQFATGIGKLTRAQLAAKRDVLGVNPQSARRVRSVLDLTPGDVAGGALWGYALPSRQSGPTYTEILASMSPESRSYVTKLMRLTFRQLAAGAAGQP
jgi:hypothetical protein